MAICEVCGKDTVDHISLRCDHFLCSSCLDQVEFKTVCAERGLECPTCSTFSPKNYITQETRQFDLPGQDLHMADSSVWPSSVRNLCKDQYVELKSVKLDFGCKGLAMSVLSDEMWITCPEQNLILIYSLEGEFVRKQAVCGNLSNPRAVVQSSYGEFVFASMDHGVATVDTRSGQIIYQLTPGSYAHLCMNKDILYCLEYEQGVVKVFERIENKWVEERSIQLQEYNSGDENDTICVCQTSIYIGSWFGNCLYRYSMDGQKEKTFGERGKQGAGYLFRPRIVAHDLSGSLLVCDSMNGRLQVLKPNLGDGKWYLTSLQKLKFPHFAAPLPSRNGVWVLHNKENTLTLYVPKSD